MTFRKIVFLAIWLLTGSVSFGQTADKKTLTLDGAERVIAAAKAKAQELKSPGGVIAVVDAGGNLMALARLDGTFAAGANISIGKARTAVLFQKPTKVFEDIINKGRTAMAALPDSFFTPLQGGIPVVLDGQIIGGVGVSGASSAAQDEELAIAGSEAAKAFGYSSYTIRDVNVGSGRNVQPYPRMMAMAAAPMDSAKMSAPIAVEGGKATVSVTVNGSVQMK